MPHSDGLGIESGWSRQGQCMQSEIDTKRQKEKQEERELAGKGDDIQRDGLTVRMINVASLHAIIRYGAPYHILMTLLYID